MNKEEQLPDNVVLAELMGPPAAHADWTLYKIGGRWYWKVDFYDDQEIPVAAPDYDTDLNAMLKVWDVLYEQGLWDKFLEPWAWKKVGYGRILGSNGLRDFLNDLPGQVKSAIQVFHTGLPQTR